MKSDTEIADSTVLEEIDTIARKASIPVENLFHYGPYIAKVPRKYHRPTLSAWFSNPVTDTVPLRLAERDLPPDGCR